MVLNSTPYTLTVPANTTVYGQCATAWFPIDQVKRMKLFAEAFHPSLKFGVQVTHDPNKDVPVLVPSTPSEFTVNNSSYLKRISPTFDMKGDEWFAYPYARIFATNSNTTQDLTGTVHLVMEMM